MKEIEFEIVDSQLEELGIEQESQYTILRFRESALSAYWISGNSESDDLVINIYVDSLKFMCKYSERNIKLLNSILNESSSSNNNVQQA